VTAPVLDHRREHAMTAFICVVAGAAAALTSLFVARALPTLRDDMDWIIFAIFGTLLFLAETRPSFTMKFGDDGVISPGWTFAYALVLFGMPVTALAVLIAATVLASVQDRKSFGIMVLNVSVLAASISSGALVLRAFGMRTSMTALDTIPASWAIGIVLGAVTMLFVNGFLIALAIGIKTGTGFITTLRSGLALTMTADGALLSLAPVFVIAIDYSLVLVPLLASTSYIVIRSARKSLHRAHEASHDPLTALLNRRAFNDRVSQSVGTAAHAREAIVLVMDFDRFKEINDSLGHAVGDLLLIGFADRLQATLPPTAAAARLGGDEFAVLVPGARSLQETQDLARSLRAALVQPYDIDGFPLTMSVSIGVSSAPDDGTNVDDLLAAADLAMYQAKQFQSGIEYHQSTVIGTPQASHPGRISLLGELKAAIDNGHLVVHYQPQIDNATGAIDTVEALVRWRHSEHGLILPDDFIGLAEQTDLIDALTVDVLRGSMRDVLSLGRQEIALAVNVSTRSLHNRTFAAMVFETASQEGFPLDRLELEITERALASDPARMSLTIARLRNVGVRIAIDDFGTGYSSFASLRQIPADRLKIDRSFTRQLASSHEDRLVVRAVTELGHGLGLKVVAEGVENPEVLKLVRELDCDFSQGFGIAKPLPIDELKRFTLPPVNGRRLAALA
jgi:diguanylate cyclase (GGDEF)-like protein